MIDVPIYVVSYNIMTRNVQGLKNLRGDMVIRVEYPKNLSLSL